MGEKKIALITGGNRGLGFGTCRRLAHLNYEVILASRDLHKGEEKVNELRREGLNVHFLQLDLEKSDSIERAYKEVEKRWGRLDVLINNAGILMDLNSSPDSKKEDSFQLHRENLEKTFQINVVGPYELCERFGKLMRVNHFGRIVNVSSGLGQLSQMSQGYESYRISKAALNAVTRIFAGQFRHANILVNSVDPGWVKTDMGGASAPRSLEEGVSGIIWAATLPENGPTGGFFRDGQPIEW